MLGRRDEAIPHFEKALALNATYSPAAFHLGVALWLKTRRTRSCVSEDCKRAEAARTSIIARGMRQALDQIGSHAEAAREFRAASALRPGDGDNWHRLGLAAQRAGDRHSRSRGIHESARSSTPAIMTCGTILASSLVEMGEADRGLAEFDAVLQSRPEERRRDRQHRFRASCRRVNIAKAVEQYQKRYRSSRTPRRFTTISDWLTSSKTISSRPKPSTARNRTRQRSCRSALYAWDHSLAGRRVR